MAMLWGTCWDTCYQQPGLHVAVLGDLGDILHGLQCADLLSKGGYDDWGITHWVRLTSAVTKREGCTSGCARPLS